MRASILRWSQHPGLSYSSSAFGCTPMWLAMIISRRARPMPGVRQHAEIEGAFRVGHVHHDLQRRRRHVAEVRRGALERQGLPA
jgi:hypothetical protein